MEPYPHQGILFYYVDVKTKMKDAVRTFYTHVLNAGDLSMLTDLCSDDLVFSDAVLYDEAFVGAKRVASVLRDYLAAYPTLRYSLLDLVADESSQTVMAHWRAGGAHLGPDSFMGHPPTGRMSAIAGITMFKFELEGGRVVVSSMTSFRQPLAEERAAFEQWDVDIV